MNSRFKIIAALLSVIVIVACANAVGAMAGAGIGSTTGGSTTARALIGGGIGMMIDIN